MKKGFKIAIIAVIVLIIVGLVYIKYIKPKMDERRELKRLKEADVIAAASKSTTASDSKIVSDILASAKTEYVGFGGVTVKI